MDRSKLHIMFGKTKKEKTDDEEVPLPSPVQRPEWDVPCGKRFGESKLTSTLLNEAMDGFPEPMKNVFFNIFMFMSVSLITPLVAEGQPVVRGLPWWYFKQILLTVVPYAVLFKMICKWELCLL